MAGIVRVRFAADEFVAGDLFPEKLIDWFVAIERFKNVVAIVPGVGSLGVAASPPVALGISGHVQPMPAPAHAEL